MGGYGFGLALWNHMILYGHLWIIVCDILIQLNWIVLAYNFNLVTWC
jgi:hypothetical protein